MRRLGRPPQEVLDKLLAARMSGKTWAEVAKQVPGTTARQAQHRVECWTAYKWMEKPKITWKQADPVPEAQRTYRKRLLRTAIRCKTCRAKIVRVPCVLCCPQAYA